MRPLIYEGYVIVIKKLMIEEDINHLKPGDIIQFSRDDILITHRIFQIFKDRNGNLSFQTKGDNNSAIDPRLVMPNEVRGTLTKVIPKIGLPTLLIKSRRTSEPEGVEN
jgi:signal peptidase